MTNIEFSLEIKERTFDIGLYDESAITAISVSFSLLEDGLDLVESQTHLNAVATVAIFSRLNNPCIVFLVLSFLLAAFGYFLCPLMIVPQKLKIFLIFESLFDVEGKWQIIEHILFHFLIIVAHSIEERFLIAEHIIIDQMVMHTAFLQFTCLDMLSIFEMFGSGK